MNIVDYQACIDNTVSGGQVINFLTVLVMIMWDIYLKLFFMLMTNE